MELVTRAKRDHFSSPPLYLHRVFFRFVSIRSLCLCSSYNLHCCTVSSFFSRPWTTMASLGNKVDEQVIKAPHQNGGGYRNEELQLEDMQDNNNEVRRLVDCAEYLPSRFDNRMYHANENEGSVRWKRSMLLGRVRFCFHSPCKLHAVPVTLLATQCQDNRNLDADSRVTAVHLRQFYLSMDFLLRVP